MWREKWKDELHPPPQGCFRKPFLDSRTLDLDLDSRTLDLDLDLGKFGEKIGKNFSDFEKKSIEKGAKECIV